jgi:hypothetical protein
MNRLFTFESEAFQLEAGCSCPRSHELSVVASEEEFGRSRQLPPSSPSPQPLGSPPRSLGRHHWPPSDHPRTPGGRVPPARLVAPWASWPVVLEPYADPPISGPSGWEPEPWMGSEYVWWVQNCLNKTLGLRIPLSGVIGPETRSAIRGFQRRRGIPINGILDATTHNALGLKCGNNESMTIGTKLSRKASISFPRLKEVDFFSWENEQEQPEDQEIQIREPACKINIVYLNSIKLDNRDNWKPVGSKKKDVYVIKESNTIWYVGKADKGFKERFNDRYQALHELKLDWKNLLKNTTADLYEVNGNNCIKIFSKSENSSTYKMISTNNETNALTIAEQFLIWHFGQPRKGSKKKPPGNRTARTILFDVGANLTVNLNGTSQGPSNQRIN